MNRTEADLSEIDPSWRLMDVKLNLRPVEHEEGQIWFWCIDCPVCPDWSVILPPSLLASHVIEHEEQHA
jgi:hypothetical protein